jgi:small subunit ribosomal protein S9
MADKKRPEDTEPEATPPAADDAAPETPAAEEPTPAEEPAPAAEPVAEEEPAPAAEEPAAEPVAEEEPAPAEEPAAEPVAEEEPAPAEEPAAEPVADADSGEEDGDEEEDATPREKPAIPGMDLEVDIVREGETPLRGEGSEYDEDAEDGADSDGDEDDVASQPIAVEINLAAGARYRATGKRKTSVARVILKPGTGAYVINGRTLEQHFPRFTLQRNIRQPLETVGYQDRMDVVAKIHGGGVSAQAGALRHGVSRALIDADPNLRSELKRRGFLTRDPRVKERKKAGLKKARKRPQFSKR